MKADTQEGYRQAYRDVRALFGDWEWSGPYGDGGPFAYAQLDDAPDGYVVRVLVGYDYDGDPGTIEYTPEETAAASYYTIMVEVMTPDSDVVLYRDSISNVDVVDLPGYLQRDFNDAAAYALKEYLLDAAMNFIKVEQVERDYWAARDVVTV